MVGAAEAAGPGGLIDDELSFVNPWGCDLASITVQTLLLHGGGTASSRVRMLAGSATQFRRPSSGCPNSDGHISVLRHAELALEWLRGSAHDGFRRLT